MIKIDKILQVRIDQYAFGTWFNTIDLDPYANTVTIVDAFGKEKTFTDDGTFQYREVEVVG